MPREIYVISRCMIEFNHIIDYMIKLNQKISTQDIHQWHMIKFNHILLQVYIDFTPWNIWWNIWLNLIIWHQWSTNKTLTSTYVRTHTPLRLEPCTLPTIYEQLEPDHYAILDPPLRALHDAWETSIFVGGAAQCKWVAIDRDRASCCSNVLLSVLVHHIIVKPASIGLVWDLELISWSKRKLKRWKENWKHEKIKKTTIGLAADSNPAPYDWWAPPWPLCYCSHGTIMFPYIYPWSFFLFLFFLSLFLVLKK